MTDEEIDAIEHYWQHPTGGVHEAATALAYRNIRDLVASLRESERLRVSTEAALREMQNWFIPTSDDHVYALRPKRDLDALMNHEQP